MAVVIMMTMTTMVVMTLALNFHCGFILSWKHILFIFSQSLILWMLIMAVAMRMTRTAMVVVTLALMALVGASLVFLLLWIPPSEHLPSTTAILVLCIILSLDVSGNPCA